MILFSLEVKTDLESARSTEEALDCTSTPSSQTFIDTRHTTTRRDYYKVSRNIANLAKHAPFSLAASAYMVNRLNFYSKALSFEKDILINSPNRLECMEIGALVHSHSVIIRYLKVPRSMILFFNKCICMKHFKFLNLLNTNFIA